jgi:hypothetical protein
MHQRITLIALCVLVLGLAASAFCQEMQAVQMNEELLLEDYGTESVYQGHLQYYYYIPCPTYSWFWSWTGWYPGEMLGAWFAIGDQSMGGYAPMDPGYCQHLDRIRFLDFAGAGQGNPGLYTIEFDVWCCDDQGCPVGPSLWNSGPVETHYAWNYIDVDPPLCLGDCSDPMPRILITATHTGSDCLYPAWGFDNVSTSVQNGCEMHDYGCLPALWPRPTTSHYSTMHTGYYGYNFSECPPVRFGDREGYGDIELAWRIYVTCQGPCGAMVPGTISGTVTVNSTPLGGVTVDLYRVDESLTTVFLGSAITDLADGSFDFGERDPGEYIVELILPLGYAAAEGCNLLQQFILASGEDRIVDFQLNQVLVSAEARSKGYWKHQYKVHDSNRGHAQESLADLQSYQEDIYNHFYARTDEYAIQITGVTYSGGGALIDTDALGTLSARGNAGMYEKACSQFLALLLNVVSGKIGQYHEVTADGMTVSQAITFVADLLEDADPANDELAKDIAEQVNENHQIAAGTIPDYTPSIAYEPAHTLPSGVQLNVQPNPAAEAVEIVYSVPSAGSRVVLSVYDMSGRLVRELVDGPQGAGSHRVVWLGDDVDGNTVASGMYFYRLEVNGKVSTRKIVMFR